MIHNIKIAGTIPVFALNIKTCSHLNRDIWIWNGDVGE